MRARSNKVNKFIFFIPIIALTIIILYQYISVTMMQDGTLVITAETSSRYYQPKVLHASFDVDGHSGTTPYSLSLPQGVYLVRFHDIDWFKTPAPRSIPLLAGKTAYAIGIYEPIARAIGITSEGFNVTSLTAMHGVTPIIWVNEMNDYAVLFGAGFNKTIINPHGNFTYVFDKPGRYEFTLFGKDFSGYINVS